MEPSLSLREPFVLLDDNKSESGGALLFRDPARRVICRSLDEVAQGFADLDAGRRQGLYAAGSFAYELGQAFAYSVEGARRTPAAALIDLGLFRICQRLTPQQTETLLETLGSEGLPPAIHSVRMSHGEADYCEDIARIKAYLCAGDTYQVNYTLNCEFRHSGDPVRLFQALRARQRVEYGAFVNFPERRVLSLSPELFLRKRGTTLICKPMKGTSERGRTPAEDDALVAWLARDVKSQAEHIMIVDLVRNDLGRLCETGSVEVTRLREVERYETVLQMTSTVRARLTADIPLRAVFQAMFPCGSITGAPKRRTMQIIDELEGRERGVYTGAIGYVTPANDFCFSVPIRTCVLHSDGRGEMGIGSGIVYDSDARAEYAECLLKARFLTGVNTGFHLFESLFFDRAVGCPHLARHMNRLESSCTAFGFSFDRAAAEAALNEVGLGCAQGSHKLKLMVEPDGTLRVEAAPLAEAPPGALPTVVIAGARVRSDNIFQYHKTSRRGHYETAARACVEHGLYDAIFLNERDEVAEASRHNVIIQRAGRWYTPPVEAGLLAGVMRQILLEDPAYDMEIAPITRAELFDAERIWLVNSVRGMVEVSLDPHQGNV